MTGINPEIPENQVAREIVDAAFHIHAQLGPGLNETVYEIVLEKSLQKRGLRVKRQEKVQIIFDGLTFEEGFRADLIVADLVIVELKAIETVLPLHRKQLQTYLRLSNLRLGLLINFDEVLIKDGIYRVVNGLPEEPGIRPPNRALRVG